MSTDPDKAVEAAKHEARTRARAARCALDDATCREAAIAAAERLVALPEVAGARLVLAYGATPEELDPAPAVAILRARGVAIAYPRVEAPGVLGLHSVGVADPLVRGMFGIMEPSSHAPRVPAKAVDAVIVPGVAFDRGLWRLGYGGGYYDRLLPLLGSQCARIGFAYDEQVLDEIPVEEYDVCLDLLVTPSGVVRKKA